MSIKVALALATVSLAAVAQQAGAATVYLNDVSPRASMTVTFPGLGAASTPYVGQINWTFDRSAPDNALLASLLPDNNLHTFCIEGTQDVWLNSTAHFASVFNDISLAPQDNVGSHFEMGATKAATLNRFWDDYYSQAATSSVNGAAFQVGIWEILYDNTHDLTAGAFRASATPDSDSGKAYDQANAWLANINTVIPTTHYELHALSDPYLQDQLFGVPTAGHDDRPNPVPLPAALPVGLAMMGALGVARKLRKRLA